MSTTEDSIQNADTYDEAGGTSYESMVVTTDSLEELTQEMSTELAKLTVGNNEITLSANKEQQDNEPIQSSNYGESSKSISINDLVDVVDDGRPTEINCGNKLDNNDESIEKDIDYLHDSNWLNKNEHVFILSTAGKPIYSLHGSEDKLATLFGVMQALVSVFQSNQDTLMSIHAIGIQFVYLVRQPLILVAASRKKLSVQQIQLQLTSV